MGNLGSGGSGDSSLRWRWGWSESDLNLVVNALEQEFSRERHYFALLSGSQSPNQSFKDVGTSIVIEQHTKRHLNPNTKRKPKNQINPQRSYQIKINILFRSDRRKAIKKEQLTRSRNEKSTWDWKDERRPCKSHQAGENQDDGSLPQVSESPPLRSFSLLFGIQSRDLSARWQMMMICLLLSPPDQHLCLNLIWW